MKLFFTFNVKLLLVGCALLALVSCSAGGDNGGSGSASISAVATDGCNNIRNSESCTITLTYSSGGLSGLILTNTSFPGKPFDFVRSMLKCPLPSSSGNSEMCQLNVGYEAQLAPFSQQVTFQLQNQKDKSIVTSSNPITLATTGSN